MSQNVDHLGRNGCFLVVLAEVVCVLGVSVVVWSGFVGRVF